MNCIRRIYLSALFILSLTLSYSQSQLKVEITNLRSDKGTIAMELLDSEEQSIKTVIQSIEGNTCTIIIEGLENEKYAIRYFHDENSNEEMDKNWMGIPKEGYGFSNDAYGTFGPKDFDEWLFIVDGNTEIKLKTKY